MGKRGNGEGSISRYKDGRWCARYTVQTAKGPKRKVLYGKTRQEAAEKLAKALADRSGGLVFEAGTLTLGDYLDRWLNSSVRGTVRQRTWERYEQIARVHIKPPLGRVKLKALTTAHVRGLYREKLDAGLTQRTVQYVHTTLRKALKDAGRGWAHSPQRNRRNKGPEAQEEGDDLPLPRPGTHVPGSCTWRPLRSPLHAGRSLRA